MTKFDALSLSVAKYHAVNEDKDGSVHRSGGPAAGTRGMMIKEKRPGYCECCTTRFEDLEMVSQCGHWHF